MGYQPKHRVERATRPTAKASLATLATAAVIVAPVVAAAPADAASEHTWDRLANCESSGRWHIDTGNGYYGGVQFSYSTWRSFGGGRFAGRADRATRDQQITVAQRTLHAQGWNAWPSCSDQLGLDSRDAREPRHGWDSNRNGDRRTHQRAEGDRTTQHRRPSSGATYVVRSGDTLSKIAQRKGVDGGWRAIYRVNRDRINNPNHIRVGQRLHLP